MAEATGQGKEGQGKMHSLTTVMLLCALAQAACAGHPTYKFLNMREPSMDMTLVTNRAARTLLWTKLIRGLGRVLSSQLWEPATINYPREGPTGSTFPQGACTAPPSIHPSMRRCTAGQLCQATCPYQAITSEAEPWGPCHPQGHLL